MSEQGEEACKYCHGPADEDEGGSFVLPCACRTPLHQRCLFQWICFKRCETCEICQERWQAIMPVSVETMLGALEEGRHAQQAQGAQTQGEVQLIAAVLHAFANDVNRRVMQLGRQVEQTVREAMLEQQKERDARERAEAARDEHLRRLQAARERERRLEAELRAVQQAAQLGEGAAAVTAALERASKAEEACKSATDYAARLEKDKLELKQEVRVVSDERNQLRTAHGKSMREVDKLEQKSNALQAHIQRIQRAPGAGGGRPPGPPRPWWQVWAARGGVAAAGAAMAVLADRRFRQAPRQAPAGAAAPAGRRQQQQNTAPS